MSKPYFCVKNGLLFPIQFQILGYVLLFSGLFLFVENIWTSIFFILLGGLIVSAFSGTEFKSNYFREFNAFFFVKYGKWQSYGEVEKLFIKKVKRSQKLYGRANQSSTIRSSLYKAFAKFDNGSSVLLLENKNKSKLKEKLSKVADYLQTEVVDYSD